MRPRYCGLAAILVVATLVAGGAPLDAQGRRRRVPLPKPATLLLPAETAWTVTLADAAAAPGVAAHGVAVVPLASGELHAFDWETGQARWMHSFATTTAPAAAGDVIAAAGAQTIAAVRAADGSAAWQHTVRSAPIALLGAGATIYALDEERITAIDAATGRERWDSSTDGRPGFMAAGPRGIAVTQADDRVMLFAEADGRRLWIRQLDAPLRAPAWAGDTLIVPSADRTVWALDGGNGSIKWEWTLGGAAAGVAGDADRVYIAGLDNVLRAVNRGNGHQRWQQTLTTRPQAGPIVLDGAVIVAGLSPAMALFNTLTGAPLGTQTATAGLVGAPLVDRRLRPGTIGAVLVLRDGRLIGVRPVGLQFRELAATPLTALPGRSVPRERLP